MGKLSMLVAKLKDKYATKITVPCFAPAVCPACGAQIEVPLLRTPMQVKCSICETFVWVVSMGLLNLKEDDLKYMHNEVVRYINSTSQSYKDTHLH
jgi:hypothetical protein